MMRRKWRSAAARRIKEFSGKRSVDEAVGEIARRLTEGQCAPIDLVEVFPRVAIKRVYVDPTLPFAGELRKSDDGFEIAICSHDSSERTRFTIAHEIGHAVFERTGAHRPRSGKELELICDMIAAEILMPRNLLRQFDHREPTMAQIIKLAKTFDTSLTAMAIRCANTFGFMLAGTEMGELAWVHVPPAWKIMRARTQLKRLCAKIDSDRGKRTCSIQTWQSTKLHVRMEWITTGENRQLFSLAQLEN
jgi:hypothetical protein